MSYASFTLRKPKRKKEVVTLFDDDQNTNSIYSTLSRKPADLKTTDIDLTAIRIFLSDGSHRTISSTPSTTCGEILSRLLDKLNLLHQKSSYRLQIRYQFGEARIAKDSEQVSELNNHVWDSVDRIYLCKLSPLHIRRKRLTSIDASEALDEHENLYENCAVIAAQNAVTPVDDMESPMDPVLVNDKIARGFASAWNVGSEQHEFGEQRGRKPPTPITAVRVLGDEVSPRRSYASYTLDRKRKKNTNLKRSSPVSTSPNTTPLPRRSKMSNSPNGVDSISSSKAPDHFRMPLSPEAGEITSIGKQSVEITTSFVGDANLRNLTPGSSPTSKNRQTFISLNKKFGSEGNLVSLGVIDVEKTWASTLDLRDSGFQDQSENVTGSLCSVSSTHSCTINGSQVFLRRRQSSSAESIPCSLQASKNISGSVPSLATHTIRASPIREAEEKTNLNAATLKSYRSMELLTGDDFEAIQTNLSKKAVTLSSCNLAKFPDIPKRVSSHMENCTVSDEYLLNQGKRLSHILNACQQPKKQEKNHLRVLISKIAGTFQLKKNKSTCSLPRTPPSTQCTLHPPNFPSGPPPPVAPRPEISSPLHSSYIPIESISVPTSSYGTLAQQGRSTLTPSLQGSKKPEYLQVLSPTSPTIKSHSPAYENNKLEDIPQSFYQVPPTPNQNGRPPSYENKDMDDNSQPYYQVPPTPNQSSHPTSYENNELDENLQDFYQVPPSAIPVGVKQNETSVYENKNINCGPQNQIMFNSNKLHIYSTPRSTLTSPTGESTPIINSQTQVTQLGQADTSGVNRVLIYENNKIESSSKDGISIGGEELHVYQVPPSNISLSVSMNSNIPPPPPPPPILPPKPPPAVAPKPTHSAPPPLPPKPIDACTTPQLPPKPIDACTTPQLPPKPVQMDATCNPPLITPKLGLTNDVNAPPLLPPKPPPLPPIAPPAIVKSSSAATMTFLEHKKAPHGKDRAATAPTPTEVNTLGVSHYKPNTISTGYYEDVSDWIAEMKDEGYSKLDWGLSTSRKQQNCESLSQSVNEKLKNFSSPKRQNHDWLYSTVSEPDLRESQAYDSITEMTNELEEDNMYVVMAGAGSIIRYSSMEDVSQHKLNSKGQQAPKCPPKPHHKNQNSSKRFANLTTPGSVSNVRDKIAALLNGESHQSHATNSSPASKMPPTHAQTLPQISTLPASAYRPTINAHPVRSNKIPNLPHTQTLPSKLSSLPSVSPHLSADAKLPIRPNKLPLLPLSNVRNSPSLTSASSIPFPTPHLTPPPQFAASPATPSGTKSKKGPLPPTPTPTPPPPPPLSTIPGVVLPSHATQSGTKTLKKGPLPPTPTSTSPPPPPPPPFSTFPGASKAFPCSPLISPSFSPTPTSFGAMTSPSPPTPPPISTIPRSTPSSSQLQHNKKLPTGLPPTTTTTTTTTTAASCSSHSPTHWIQEDQSTVHG